ncbi:hypothetical protein JTE90_013580 [Oedothorax gibbosus]|uniref:Choline/ethanolamine kinase n=1 Tax=Oedothorax gibbosus TaxID=931172 RepID=A0AAV6VGC7_9ARAC|nr:hypothetical protein JTE90_013580 [Oedothorax gibbosus]
MSRSQLFVGRLPIDIREQDVEKVFEKYGRLLRCDVKYGMYGASGRRGSGRTGMAYAFVDYDDRRDAEDAIRYENGREMHGQSIVVEWARGPSNRNRRDGSYGRSSRQSEECYRCRRTGHWARDCPEDRDRRGYRSRNRSRSRSRSRSYRRSRRSVSRSRSRSRDRRRRSFSGYGRKSRSGSRDKRDSKRSASRSVSPSKTLSRSRSRSHDKNRNSDKSKKKSRTPSKSMSRSRSPSKSRSRSPSFVEKDRCSPQKSPNTYEDKNADGEFEKSRSMSRSPRKSSSRSPSKENNREYDNESDRSLSLFFNLNRHPVIRIQPTLLTSLRIVCNDSGTSRPKMRDQAYRICRDYLSGSWKSISSSDMVFRSVSGGMSNFLYYCSLPETHTPLVGEPHQVLMRMYGQIHEGVEAKVTESVIFMMLSERNLGPKLYGIFPGGRLEEYIPARAMTCDELKGSEMSVTIARKLAKVHTLNVPINKEPKWLFDKMQTWINFAKDEIRLDALNDDQKKIAVDLLSQDFEKEFAWLKSVLTKANSPVLFCHNDLQEGNILVPEGDASEDKIVFIDFEYCSYNFRAFDIANHFCEWCFDYSASEYPHFTAKEGEFPSISQQLSFIESYLKNFQSTCSDTEISEEINNPQHVLEEVLVFTLASHFLWTLWSIVNAQNSQIEFGYWEYGKARWDAYMNHKKEVLKHENLDALTQEER